MTVPGKGLLVLEHAVGERVSSLRRAWILLGNWTENFYLLKTCKRFIICSNQANILLFQILLRKLSFFTQIKALGCLIHVWSWTILIFEITVGWAILVQLAVN